MPARAERFRSSALILAKGGRCAALWLPGTCGHRAFAFDYAVIILSSRIGRSRTRTPSGMEESIGDRHTGPDVAEFARALDPNRVHPVIPFPSA
jgi:hypothetical protein